ncbi:MAG TPA: hypothetical protein VIG30_03630 [Ktedonobacterales bacterium]
MYSASAHPRQSEATRTTERDIEEASTTASLPAERTETRPPDQLPDGESGSQSALSSEENGSGNTPRPLLTPGRDGGGDPAPGRDGGGDLPPLPTPGRGRGTGSRAVPRLVALLVLAAVVLLVVPGTKPATPIAAEAQPTPVATATATPAPTTTVTPAATALPTPLPGYALYVDDKSGFLIQYPETWSKENLVPSIQFYDSAQSTYVVTILPADPNNAPATTDATAAAMNWVNLTLEGIQQEETVQNFQRLTGPTPAATIGAQVWQSGVATFGPTDALNRVQVYATVFDGTPYVITLVAPDNLFDAGRILYFKPMLATFHFLTPSL